MKSFGIIHILFFIIFMIVYQCANAQDYIVTTKGDTLSGDVKPLLFGTDKKVQLTDSNKKKTVYPFNQVRSYSYKSQIFQPVKGPAGYTFMKLIKPGYLSLYAFQLENQSTYDGQYLAKRDGTGIEVPNLSFKKALKNFLKECEVVVSKIDNGTLGKRDLATIVDEYNSCISDQTKDHKQIIAQQAVQSKKINSWDALEDKVKTTEFEGKASALEMIQEIKSKIARNEKIPNFLVEGLKSSLAKAQVDDALDAALKEIN